ncbi:MAG: hypothetical protein F4045_04190 [Chloroflexi bacterium]|nr:hypothetical protein [Chloroflexota bacterium]MYK34315.1 hypothetical protein [Chloroflexota bacterium]
MDEQDVRLMEAIASTRVVRPPQQGLATFGSTSVRYYLVTDPSYRDLDAPQDGHEESVVREGVVRAERPRVVTPYYLLRHEGFGDNADRYLQRLAEEIGPDHPGLMYHYKNEGAETAVVSGTVEEVTRRIVERLDKERKPLEAVITGSDDLWDLSLMKFIYEFTTQSAQTNVSEMRAQGLLRTEGGVPMEAHLHIERMLEEARSGQREPRDVHREIERWDLFDEYQDRFFALFR